MTRKLASIQKVAEIRPIPEADKICAYRVNDWWIVDSVGKYQVGELLCYLEIDSWVPHALAPFLSKGKEPRVYHGVPGEKLRTIKLRGTLSQGLLIPLSTVGEIQAIDGVKFLHINNTDDLTKESQDVGIQNNQYHKR